MDFINGKDYPIYYYGKKMIQTTNQPLIMWLFQQFQTHPVWLWGNHQVSSCVLGKPYCGCLQLIHRLSWVFWLFRHIGFNTFFKNLFNICESWQKKIRGFLLGHLLVFRLIVLTDLTGRIGSPLVDFATFRHQFQLHPPPALPAPRPELLPALLRRPLRERWRRCAPRCAPRAPGVDRKVGFFLLGDSRSTHGRSNWTFGHFSEKWSHLTSMNADESSIEI